MDPPWRSALHQVREHLVATAIIVLVLAVLVAGLYRAQDRTILSSEIEGNLRGVHALQGNTGTATLFAVALEDGTVVLVHPPSGTSFKQGAKVLLVKHTSAQGRESFSFKSYVPQ